MEKAQKTLVGSRFESAREPRWLKTLTRHCRVSLLRYAFAIVATVAATWVRVEMTPQIKDHMPFGTFFLSVILVAWLCGPGPTVLALGLSVIFAAHFVIPPESSLMISELSDQIALAVFAIVGGISISLFHRLDSQYQVARKVAEDNARLNFKLVDADQKKDDFLSVLSHELRGPLASMRYANEIILRSANDPKRVREVSCVHSRNLAHLVRLVDDLLDVTRYLRGKIVLQRETSDLRNCVSSAVDMVHDEVRNKGHQLTVEMPQRPVMVFADPVRVCQIVSNLLTNAVRYTDAGGRIAVVLACSPSGVTVRVRDNGIGLSESACEHIFEPFYQEDERNSPCSRGLGLGLAIAWALAELHEGRIEATSDGPGTGSEFTLHLPVTILRNGCWHPRTEPDFDMERREATFSQGGDSRRIMIVEDDHDTATMLGQLLEMEGYETLVAHDGPAALLASDSFRPDFIVLDVGLPGMNGYEIARQMRAKSWGAEVTIIGVTGWGTAEHRQQGCEAGFDVHLVKPVTLAQLTPHLVPRTPLEGTLTRTQTRACQSGEVARLAATSQAP